MASGRGRGRGKANLSFDVSSLGFGRGESLPGTILQPPPLFPSLDYKPLPLTTSDTDLYILAVKQEFRAAMKDTPYYCDSDDTPHSGKAETAGQWMPNWRNIPKELRMTSKLTSKKKKERVEKEEKVLKIVTAENIETIDTNQEVPKDNEENEDDEEDGDVEEIYEEDEEENDYNFNYFDDGGDDYGADDDPDEGPVY